MWFWNLKRMWIYRAYSLLTSPTISRTDTATHRNISIPALISAPDRKSFFKFYKSEILDKDLEPSETFYALAELEKQENCRPLFLKIVFLFLKEPVVNMYIIFMGPFTKTYAHIVGKNILSNL